MRKVIGVVFSDIHFANWKQFNPDEKRLDVSRKAMNKIIVASLKYKCPILFSGDLIDHPKWAENAVLKHLAQSSVELRFAEKKVIGINGNHDFYETSTFDNQTRGYMTYLSQMGAPFICVDFNHYDTQEYRVHGIPYLNNNVGFVDALKQRIERKHKTKPNILLIHRDLYGAQEPDGKIVKKDTDGDDEIRKLFKKFDLVISGHIHKPQYIKKLGKNILMCGATNQQRRSDKYCPMGYWLIHDDFTSTFVDLKLPEFKEYTRGEEHPDTDDFWIELPNIEKTDKNTSGMVFKAAASKESLIKKYFKVKGIKSKRKFKTLMELIND